MLVSRTRRRRNPAGFTLVEILVTLAIVGLLSGIAIAQAKDSLEGARVLKTITDVKVVSDALYQVRMDHGDFLPMSGKVADIVYLLDSYVPGVPVVDAWGNDLYFSIVTVSADTGGGGGGGNKVTICHVPPGNPENAHTLTIAAPAVAAHLANHPDYLGECGEQVSGASRPSVSYQVFSHGRDGSPDGEEITGQWLGYDSDIVSVDGALVQTRW